MEEPFIPLLSHEVPVQGSVGRSQVMATRTARDGGGAPTDRDVADISQRPLLLHDSQQTFLSTYVQLSPAYFPR